MADPNVNTQAEILANVRNKALEEAARKCDDRTSRTNTRCDDRTLPQEYQNEAAACARAIRALKTEEK